LKGLSFLIQKSNSGFSLLELAIVIAMIGILAAVAIPKWVNMTNNAQGTVARSLFKSLQTSVAVYVVQQKVPATTFNNFITVSGAATPPYVVTLDGILPQLTGGSAGVAGLNTTQMSLSFTNGGTASYYLNGTDVTASYNFP
jgi:prepilin-type N-terminal cleavage/methylation domain-containing protein